MEYRWNKYPDFCIGIFYAMSKSIAVKLFKKFEETVHQNYISIEDVYLTGNTLFTYNVIYSTDLIVEKVR